MSRVRVNARSGAMRGQAPSPEQQAAMDSVRQLQDAATQRLVEGDEMAAQEQRRTEAIRGSIENTGHPNTNAIDMGLIQRKAPQAAMREGNYGEQQATAGYVIPPKPGQVPLREAPGFIEHESRLWSQGLRSSIPLEDDEAAALDELLRARRGMMI